MALNPSEEQDYAFQFVILRAKDLRLGFDNDPSELANAYHNFLEKVSKTDPDYRKVKHMTLDGITFTNEDLEGLIRSGAPEIKEVIKVWAAML